MKPTTVALLILINMMCTIGYFVMQVFLEQRPTKTTLLANSYGTNEGTGFSKGINLGRKLTVRARTWDSRDICCKMTSNPCKLTYAC